MKRMIEKQRMRKEIARSGGNLRSRLVREILGNASPGRVASRN